MGIIIPEVQLCNVLVTVVSHVKADYEKNQTDSTPEQSLLYRYFHGTVDHKKNYYDEAVDLFTRGVDHPRRIDVRMAFDAKRAPIPTVHITMPSDQSGDNSLGVGETSDTEIVEDQIVVNYERRFNTEYQIVCTSDQHSETLLMYHLIRAALISTFDAFSMAGIENIRLSGQELKINPDLAPSHIFMRSIGVSFSYDVVVPRWWNEKLINDIVVGKLTHINSEIDL